MNTQRFVLAIGLLLITLWPGSGSATIVGISSDRFTIDGANANLACTSYFDAKEWKQSDLTALRAAGYNCIRIFDSWIYSDLSTWDIYLSSTLSTVDNFNRPNEGPPPSASWTTSSGNGVNVISNQAGTPTPNTTVDDSATYNTGITGDQAIEATLAVVPASGVNDFAILGLCQATNSTANCYRAEIDNATGTPRVRLFEYNGTDCTAGCQLGSTYAPASLTNGTVVRVQRTGSLIKLFYGGIERTSATDTTHSGTSYGMIGSYMDSGSSAVRWDDVKRGVPSASIDTSVGATILSLNQAADALGMVVLHVLAWHSLSDTFTTVADRQAIFAAMGNYFAGCLNCLFDLHNEHNYVDAGYTAWGETPSDMQPYFDAFKLACPTCKATASTAPVPADYLVGNCGGSTDANIDAEAGIAGLDFFTPHFERNSDWDNCSGERTAAVKTRLAAIGRNIPILLDEEIRFGNGGGGTHEPTVAEFALGAQEAMEAGAAGWLWHTDCGFDLRSGATFMSCVNGNSDYLAAFTQTPGIVGAPTGPTTPITIRQSCGPTMTDDGTTAVVTCAGLPLVGSKMLLSISYGQGTGAPAATCLLNPLDSAGHEFFLAVEAPASDGLRTYIWYQDITIQPSGSYSITVTCPAASHLLVSAIEVSGLLPGLGVHDVSGWAVTAGGTTHALTGFQPTSVADTLRIAVLAHTATSSNGVSFSDNANRANEGPPPSADWLTRNGTGLKVISNTFRNDNTTGGSTTDLAIHDTVVGADMDVTVDVTGAPNLNELDYFVIAGRVQGTSGSMNGYQIEGTRSTGTPQIKLQRYVSGVNQPLGVTVNPSVITGTYILRFSGTSIKVLKDGAEIIDATDSTFTGSGYCGLGVYRDPAGSGSGVVMDNFSCSATSTPTITPQAGWTVQASQDFCLPASGGHQCGQHLTQIGTQIETPVHTWTFSSSITSAVSALAAFKAASTGGGNTITRTLTWTDNATNETAFSVQKKTDQTGSTWVDVATGLPANTTTYQATILTTETGDCWRVWAERDIPGVGIVSAVSNEYCVATAPPPPPPPPPTGLTIGQLNSLLEEELL